MTPPNNSPNPHDFAATLQYGTVAAVDAARHTLRVTLPALEHLQTDWLPMITQAAGGNRFYSLPDVGELVVCLLDARGEGGVVLGAIYNAADTPPAADADIWRKQFSNGTVIEHDRASGDVLIKTSGKVSIDAPEVEISGNLLVKGSLTYQGGMSGSGGNGAAATITGTLKATGDISAGGISLQQHTHPGDSGGTTGTAQ